MSLRITLLVLVQAATAAADVASSRVPRETCLGALSDATSDAWEDLDSAALAWQLNKTNCPTQHFDSMADVETAVEAGTTDADAHVVRLLLTREVRGAVLPFNKYGVQCSADELSSEPCKCFGGAARISGAFGQIRTDYATLTRDSDLVATLDLGGYFFGSGLFYPWNEGETSAEMMDHAKYDVAGTNYLDWTPKSSAQELADHLTATGTPIVTTNLILAAGDPLEAVIAKSKTLVADDGSTRMAVLSLMDPTFIATSNPQFASVVMPDYEQAINTELALLRRRADDNGEGRPQIVVAMVWGIPTTAEEEEAAGGRTAAKLAAIETLIAKTIGVDVYILSSFDGVVADGDAYTTKNWAGDDVLVVPLHSSSKQGKTIEVVQAAFNDKGLLLDELSGSRTIELNCNVPEDADAKAAVAAAEDSRKDAMSTPIATLTAEVHGIEIFGENFVVDANFDVNGDDYCAILVSNAASGEKVGKCGCRVSQCSAGSLLADAMQHLSGADFAVANGGGIRGDLPEGQVTKEDVRAMLPFLNEVVLIKNMKGSTVRAMITNSISQLSAADVTTNPDGRYLQVSRGLQVEWYFEGNEIKLGSVYVCSQRGAPGAPGSEVPACESSADFELLDDDNEYAVAAPGFIALGGDEYGMLEEGYTSGQTHQNLHASQYETVDAYLIAMNGGDVGAPLDIAGDHARPAPSNNCAGVAATARVCQTRDLVRIPIGVYCQDGGPATVQECDQAHHMVAVINNKADGFMDNLLPHAKIVLHENHVTAGCSKGEARDAAGRLTIEAEKLGKVGDRFVATIGPGCSNDVEDVTGKNWRADSGNQNLVISGSSTSTTLADEAAFPNLARMSTSEVGVGAGFALLCQTYGWNRVAIVHDSSTWGTDAAKQFEAKMLADNPKNELIYMDFDSSTLDRTECAGFDPKFGANNGRIGNAKSGCDPVTSFSVTKVRAAYPDGEGAGCEPGNRDHFCVTEVIKKLKELKAKIIFIAAQRDTQLALFREIYKNREIDGMDIHGEGYAYMSALVGEELFVKKDGSVDTDALKGALGSLGVRETIDKEAETFKLYSKRWGDASSPEACCHDDTTCADHTTETACGADEPQACAWEGGACSSMDCKRVSFINRTVLDGPHNYCDTDGNGNTAASYSFSIADAVLTLARALEYNNVYAETPNDAALLYQSLLGYSADTSTDKSGITGSINFDPDSGDRNGDLEIVNLQQQKVGIGGEDGSPSRNRRAVLLSSESAVFQVVGHLRVQEGSADRVLETSSGDGKMDVSFPGDTKVVPSDTWPLDNIGAIIGGVVAAFLVLGIVGFVYHKRSVAGLKEEVAKLGKTLVGVRHVTSPVDYGSMGIETPPSGADTYLDVGEYDGFGSGTVATPEQPSAPAYRWYWQEGSDRMDSHNKFDVLQPGNWVSYAWGVCAELDAQYAKWHAKKGPAKISIDLTNRIASTGTESKAHGSDTGVDFQINFEHMTQKNLKSGFVRPIHMVQVQVSKLEANTSFLGGGGGSGAAVKPKKIATGLPADLAGLPDFQLLIVKPGQLVQQHEVRDDGWAFGAVLFDPTADSNSSSSSASSTKPLRKASTNVTYDSNNGWFPLSCTELANAKHLEQLQAKMGSNAAEALAAPSHWDKVRDALVAERITLPNGPEKDAAVKEFKASLQGSGVQIVSVDRVQNMAMYQSYAVKRQGMIMRDKSKGDRSIGHKEKVWLFHGTAADTVPKIIQQGFSRSFAGKNATMYGKGVYFAKNSSYSASTTYSPPDKNGVQRMFLCRVLTGFDCKGNRDQLVPDVRDSARHILYDTTTNPDKTIFVTYHDSQQYPEYIIEFRSRQ